MSRLLFSRYNRDGKRAVDCLVEYLRALWERERRAVFCLVGIVILDNSDEVVYRIGFILLDEIQNT